MIIDRLFSVAGSLRVKSQARNAAWFELAYVLIKNPFPVVVPNDADPDADADATNAGGGWGEAGGVEGGKGRAEDDPLAPHFHTLSITIDI